MTLVALLLASALPAATLVPARVPARGRQAATLTVERPGMVRLAASGGGGTACTVVDQLRGPFATSGAAGRADCAADLLLDAGPYRVLLESRERGEGEVTLTAALFPEVSPEPLRLEPGGTAEAELPDGQQASWWLHLDARAPVTLRVAGRTAGAVHLWRAGTWREELEAVHALFEPLPGQPVHEWWLEGTLEAGDYLLTAYGTGAARWARGGEPTRVAVAYGFAPAPAERAVRVRLPATGAAAFALGAGRLAAVLTTSPAAARVRLSLHAVQAGATRMAEEEAGCEVAPRAMTQECGAFTGRADGHVAVVRGPPGAEAEVRWAPMGEAPRRVDGEYRGAERRLALEPLPAGEWLVGLHDVPADRDAAPLGCALERQPEAGGPRELVAFDVPRIAPDRGWRRAFNASGEVSLWFEIGAAGAYAISARRGTCELYRVSGEPERIDGAPKACQLAPRLGPGVYELRLRGGRDGIEEVEIGPKGVRAEDAPARAGCAVRATLAAGWRYALLASRTGGALARGLVARPLPLALERALPVEVHAGETLALPVDVRGPIRVAPAGGTPAGCWLAKGGTGTWRDGACVVTATGPDTLSITAKPDAPLAAWIGRPVEPPPPAPARRFEPSPAAPMAALAPGRAARVDLAPDEDHAFVFDVAEAGLYDVGTEGLLRTRCALRTPALPRLAEDTGGGRGRNCLVSAWLRPGRYLVTVRALAPSRGRAAVVLGRRPARDLPRVDADGELFHRVAAGELVRARLAAPAAGTFELSASAQGAALRCRLEDAAGWPLAPVPGPCHGTFALPGGEVVLTALPLSVESLRRAAIARARPLEVLRGGGPHALRFFTRHRVELGKAGQDDLRFEVPVELDVVILLTNGMLGRLHREGDAEPLDLVPPSDALASAVIPDAPEDGAAEPEPEPEEGEAEDAAEVADADTETAEGDGDADAPSPEHEAVGLFRRPLAEAPPEPPAGAHRVHLAPGRYRLVAEHSRGDVAIAYEVQLSTDVLAPGMAREVAVPARLPLRVSASGTLRVRTRGDADVRCRLLDAGGRLVAQSSDVGEDWNCGLAEPVVRGDHVLVIESETGLPGSTRVEVDEPAPADAGDLADGQRLSVVPGGVSARLAPPPGDALVEVTLAGDVSCAVEDPRGEVLFRASAPAPCRTILALAGEPVRLRAWTLDRPAETTARVVARPVKRFSGGGIGAGAAARAEVRRAGRYRTGDGVLCLEGRRAGALAPCGPEVSLAEGPLLLAGLGDVRAALEELEVKVDARQETAVLAGRRPFVQRQVARDEVVHLAAVRVAPGERTAPDCRLEALEVKAPRGAVASAPGACFAAAGPSRAARLTVAADAPVEARVVRLSVPLAEAIRLPPGSTPLEVSPAGARLALPDGPWRAELLLPAGAWAVLLERGAARDLCAPADDLARCTLASAAGGEVVVVAPGERRVEVSLVTLPAPPAPAVSLADALPGAPAPLRPGEAVRLEGAAVDFSLTLAAEAAVHVRSDGGACALVPAGAPGALDPRGDGCRLDRALPAGTHHLRVRAIPGRPLAGALSVTTEPVATLGEGVGAESWLGPGDARVFAFSVASAGKIGLGVREDAERLACSVTDATGRAVSEGCQALLALDRGRYLLTVRAPADGPPARFRPVVLGLAGADTGVPEDALRELFQRIGELP
jgi:hypothetical protein